MLLAANFHAGVVEAYDSTFKLLGSFRDAQLPAKASPFNVAVLNNMIFVSYAVKNAAGHDDVPGPGHGVVEQVDATGKVLRRIAVRGALNSPWGMAIAPASFGTLAGALLVGNFGDGWINAYNLYHQCLSRPVDQERHAAGHRRAVGTDRRQRRAGRLGEQRVFQCRTERRGERTVRVADPGAIAAMTQENVTGDRTETVGKGRILT